MRPDESKTARWIHRDRPALVLAPMEGVTDAPMRAYLSERGCFDYCVSEFLRVSQDLLPPKVYYEHIPEARSGWQTPSGAPVQVQFLGGDAGLLAQSAARAVELGAKAVDLNFGCPAPTVNRHDGGATLLKYPDRIREIVSAVRAAVPKELPVSAKLRLGWDDMDSIHLNAERAVEGGASWITIHARTKVQGYKPPAHWRYIGEVRKRLPVPVVANGEIWTLDDFKRCRDETGCIHFMLGRGVMADPSLSNQVAHELGLAEGRKECAGEDFDCTPSDWRQAILRFAELSEPFTEARERAGYVLCRSKQWIKFARSQRELAWFDDFKRTQSFEEALSLLERLSRD